MNHVDFTSYGLIPGRRAMYGYWGDPAPEAARRQGVVADYLTHFLVKISLLGPVYDRLAKCPIRQQRSGSLGHCSGPCACLPHWCSLDIPDSSLMLDRSLVSGWL